MIQEYLIPALKKQFTGWEMVFDQPPEPIVTFPAHQPELGKIFVHDDGDEATVYIEKITHGHFGCYDETLSREEREKFIAEGVVSLLESLFNDRVLLYTKGKNSVGGWAVLDGRDAPVELSPLYKYYLWSKPYQSMD